MSENDLRRRTMAFEIPSNLIAMLGGFLALSGVIVLVIGRRITRRDAPAAQGAGR